MTNLNLLIEILESKFYSTSLCFSILFSTCLALYLPVIPFALCLIQNAHQHLIVFFHLSRGTRLHAWFFCNAFISIIIASLSPLWFWKSYLYVVCKGPVWMKVGVQKLIVVLLKVINSISFLPEWPKHFISIQKTEQISSHFKSRSVLDFSAKFHPEHFGFIPHVPFCS